MSISPKFHVRIYLPKSFCTATTNLSFFPMVVRPRMLRDSSERIISDCNVVPSTSSFSNFSATSSLNRVLAHSLTFLTSHSNKKKKHITYLTRQGGKTADWLLISRVILLSADLSATAQQSLKNCEFFTSVTQQIQQEMQK